MTGRTSDVVVLSVHGSAGALDLVVPADGDLRAVAEAYAEQAGLAVVPLLARSTGGPLRPTTSLAAAGVPNGSVLVALLPHELPPELAGEPAGSGRPGAGPRDGGAPVRSGSSPLAALWSTLAVTAALLGGWLAAHAPSGDQRTTAVVVLAAAAVVGLVPVGRLAEHRALAAPAFAAAATFALVWHPAPERVPTVVGTAALVAAVVAGVARALGHRGEEALRTWMVAGVTVFVTTAAGALAGAAPQVVWAVLLLAGVLAARLVPVWAVDVPDQLLVDLERLAVTAWSARDRPTGRRRRTVVRAESVAAVAERGARTVTAAAAAVLAVAVVAAPLLLATASAPLDRIGARVLVASGGVALLLAARSHRHRAARALLRAAGLACLAALVLHLLDRFDGPWGAVLAGTAIGAAAVLVVVAVATGRGWRSAWWSRRAEVLETLSGSVAVASLVVAAGLFRTLWERTY